MAGRGGRVGRNWDQLAASITQGNGSELHCVGLERRRRSRESSHCRMYEQMSGHHGITEENARK
jgi:hypothetical protein